MSKPLFSVIIPALNEEKYITRILNDLTKQTLKDFEVIVADSNSTDKTVEKANNFKKNYPLKIVNTDKSNLSHQRNIGAKSASGGIFFFIDADNSIPGDFLEKTDKYLRDKNLDAAIPRVTPGDDTLINRLSYNLTLIMLFVLLHTPRAYSTGGNLVIKNNTFKKTKGFDEKVFVGEDHDMVRQLKEIGANVRIMTATYVVFSMRRFDQEGFSTYLKYAYAFVYQLLFRKVDKHIYNYEMGGDNYK